MPLPLYFHHFCASNCTGYTWSLSISFVKGFSYLANYGKWEKRNGDMYKKRRRRTMAYPLRYGGSCASQSFSCARIIKRETFEGSNRWKKFRRVHRSADDAVPECYVRRNVSQQILYMGASLKEIRLRVRALRLALRTANNPPSECDVTGRKSLHVTSLSCPTGYTNAYTAWGRRPNVTMT